MLMHKINIKYILRSIAIRLDMHIEICTLVKSWCGFAADKNVYEVNSRYRLVHGSSSGI